MPRLNFSPEQCGLIAKGLERLADDLTESDDLDLLLALSLTRLELLQACRTELELDREARRQEQTR